MVEVLTKKVPLGVSACLADCPVRYNGKRFDALAKMGRERGDFSVTPVCPECMAGFGVPREPIHLTGPGGDVLAGEAKVQNRFGRDVTAELLAGAEACVDALERAGVRVVILKEKSPSCGLFRAKVGRSRRREVLGSGVFSAMLAEKGWFLIPDDAFNSPLTWWDWRRRMHAWLWLSDREIKTNGDLTSAWHVIKFVLQETGRATADEVGRALAALPKRASVAEIEALRSRMRELLKVPTTPQRALSYMWKTYKHASKKGTLEGIDMHELTVRSPEVLRNVTTIAEEMIALERISFENDLLFGTSPVIYREGRRVRMRDEALGKSDD